MLCLLFDARIVLTEMKNRAMIIYKNPARNGEGAEILCQQDFAA